MRAAKILRLPAPAARHEPAPARLSDRLTGLGWAPAYYPGEVNRCPSCGERQWHVGRVVAECGHCALPLLIRTNGQEQQ